MVSSKLTAGSSFFKECSLDLFYDFRGGTFKTSVCLEQ